MQRFERIQLGCALAEPLLEMVRALVGLFDRNTRKTILDTLIVRQHDLPELNIEVERPPLAQQELDLACDRYRHVVTGRIEIADVEDAHRATAGDRSLDQLDTAGVGYFTSASDNVHAVALTERHQHIVDRGFLAPDFEVIPQRDFWRNQIKARDQQLPRLDLELAAARIDEPRPLLLDEVDHGLVVPAVDEIGGRN